MTEVFGEHYRIESCRKADEWYPHLTYPYTNCGFMDAQDRIIELRDGFPNIQFRLNFIYTASEVIEL